MFLPMEATAGISKRPSLPSSVHSVMSNDDLLIEILIRLPVISILDFKIVSKHWLSIIKNPSFILRRSKTIVDPASALVIKQYFSSKYDLLPLDIRIPAVKTAFPFRFDDDHERKFVILHACNGLLLCSTKSPLPKSVYVYNPIINQFKLLPPCYNSVCITGVKMAFDPSKSPHYKIICVGDIDHSLKIFTYYSETGNWSTCSRYPFSYICFRSFGSGVYWNDAIYWYDNYHNFVFKLDVASLNLSRIVLPVGILGEGTNDRDHKLFESRGCLLLVCSVRVKHTHDRWLLKVYEMNDARSEWSVKYIVKLIDDVMMLIPTRANKSANLFSVMYIAVGEREEDSFLVIEVFGKIIQYKIVLKTVVVLFDMRLNPLEVRQLVERGRGHPIFSCFPLIASFAGV